MNYTNVTFDQLLQDFKSRLESDDRFKNISTAAIYQMFMEMICATMDMSNYYMQRVAEESFIDTAKLDSSVIKHGKNLGYNPRRRIPAQCDLQIQIKGPLPKQLRAGDSVVFNQDVVDLVYNNRKYKLNASYSYTFGADDLVGRDSTSWKKILSYACPSNNVTYLPLQGKTLYNSKNLEKIGCFQGEIETYTILGNANLSKIGKTGQFYDIDDIKFSNWYGKRDPFAFYNNNYHPELGWTKVGIGQNEDEAFSKNNIFDIEDCSIYLNEQVQDSVKTPDVPYRVCLMETNYDKTVRLRFGNNNYLTSPGITQQHQNIYVKYIKTDGKEANKSGTTGSIMTNNSSFYLQHAGEIIDITNNISFIINSDIHSGEEFESQENIKINATGYFASRFKLVTLQDFVSYFRGISNPMNVQTALVYSQHEIENGGLDSTQAPSPLIYKYIQNYVFYSLIGHMYKKLGGNYEPRNVLTAKDEIDDPFSLYADSYIDHVADYAKMLISFESYYNQQYDDNPQEQWLKNIKLLRKNCQSRMEMNSRILSMPPIVQYFDIVGKVKVKPLTKLQDYKTAVENKIYEYLDNRNGTTQKIYKSDIIKFFNDMEYTKAVDIDIKVSDIVKSDNLCYTWACGPDIVPPVQYCSLIQNVETSTARAVGATKKLINDALNTENWFSAINLNLTDYYSDDIDYTALENKRMKVEFENIDKQGNIRVDTVIMKIDSIQQPTKTESGSYVTIIPNALINFGQDYQATKSMVMYIPQADDFYTTSGFSMNKTNEYRLTANEIKKVDAMLTEWLENGTEIKEANRAIPLPYEVRTNNTLTRQETYFRKGYVINDYSSTISEKAFWMYFVPTMIKTIYNGKINANSSITGQYWEAASTLIKDIYPLVKPGFCDNILDENNNVVNFSLSQEVAVLRCKITYCYDND